MFLLRNFSLLFLFQSYVSYFSLFLTQYHSFIVMSFFFHYFPIFDIFFRSFSDYTLPYSHHFSIIICSDLLSHSILSKSLSFLSSLPPSLWYHFSSLLISLCSSPSPFLPLNIPYSLSIPQYISLQQKLNIKITSHALKIFKMRSVSRESSKGSVGGARIPKAVGIFLAFLTFQTTFCVRELSGKILK